MSETVQHSPAELAPGVASPGDTRRMVTTLSLVSALSGLLIVGAFELTAPFIDANREAMIEEAVFTVVPGGTRKQVYGFADDGLHPDPVDARFGERFYAVYDDAGLLKGLALETSGQGYQDIVRVLYGYDPESQTVIGMTVIESKETPGLGDKIAKDPEFIANFDALDARVDPGTGIIMNPITVVKHGTKDQPWEIDGISGATIGSKAVGAMMDRGLRATLPRVRPYLDTLRKAPL